MRPKTLSTALGIAVLVFLLTSMCYAQTAIQSQEGDDEGFISAIPVSSVDTSPSLPGPGSPTGTGKPPRIGTNRRVNDPQSGISQRPVWAFRNIRRQYQRRPVCGVWL